MLRSLTSIRPGRLFWKLLIAFTLATGTSFLIGVGLFELARPFTGPAQTPIATPAQIAQVLRNQGIAATLPLLRTPEAAGSLGLFRSDGTWLAGARETARDGLALDLISRDGGRYRLMVRPAHAFQINRTYPLIIGAFVSLFFSAGMAWYLARPLTLLSRGFQAVGAGRLATRVHPLVGSRRDEIADLTREFDGMAAQLQKLLAAQERLLHDISHELRSPLTRLEVAIGLLRQSPEKLPDMLARVEREADRLARPFGDLGEHMRGLAKQRALEARRIGVDLVGQPFVVGKLADEAEDEGPVAGPGGSDVQRHGRVIAKKKGRMNRPLGSSAFLRAHCGKGTLVSESDCR